MLPDLNTNGVQQASLNENSPLQPQLPPPQVGGGSGGGGSIRPGSMVDQAWRAKVPQPEAGLNCPRCDSTNTKFCYFNNYSLTQPRHFCKACRRYWTRGGALRNVPVGGGYQKNKRSKSNSATSKSQVTGLNKSTSGLVRNLTGQAYKNLDELVPVDAPPAIGPAMVPSSQLAEPYSSSRSQLQDVNFPVMPAIYDLGFHTTDSLAQILSLEKPWNATDTDREGQIQTQMCQDAHLGRAYHSGPIILNSEKKDTREGLKGECLTESVLSFDDRTKPKLLPDRTSLASFSELTSPDFDDFEHCVMKLLDLNDEFGGGLSSSCGDERINISTTNHGDRHDAALLPLVNMDTYVHKSSIQPVALPDGGEIVQLESSEKNPWEDFDATNNRSHQSGVLVSNSENQKMREASKRRCMTESVLSLVDSKTRISSTDYDAPLNRAHLLRAHQSGPIAFNSEKKDTREELHRECLTKTVLSLDDSTKQKALLDFDATEDKAHLFRACQSGLVVSLSENKSRGEALKRECITKSILSLEDLQEHCGDRCDDAAKTFGAIYDPGFHTPDALARKSFEVLETLPTEGHPIDCVPLLVQGRLPLEGCVQQEKSPDLPRVMQINRVEQRVTKMSRYLGGLTAQSASSSRRPIGLPDGGHIVLLDPLDQSTENIENVARADQCSPTVFLAEKKMVRKTLKRKCRTMSVIFEENHQHFGRRCAGAPKSLGAMRIYGNHGINQVSMLKRIHKQHGIHQWPFRQKWATRKGYSLGEENPFEVRRLSMDEKLDSRLQLIHMSQFARSSPRALALSDGGIVRPTALSSSEFAATNNRADLVSQDQSSSAASHYRCKNTRETSDKQGLEDLQQHFGCKHKYALKSLGVSGSMFKSTCRQHWFYWWQGRLKNNEQQAFDATSNRAHLVKVDERGPTVSNALFLDDLRHQFGARCKDAAKGLHAKCIRRQLVIHRLSTAKHTHKQHGIHQWPFQQSAIGLPDGGHILSLSEKKIVSKTLKRKCRSMSVLSLVDCQQHVDRRWEDATKNIGAKRICRQLVIHRVSIAKRICRQHGIHHRWPFERDWATMKGYSLGDERPVEVIRLYTDGKLVSRRRRIYISWLGRFSPWRSALPGGLIVGPIALSSSEFAGTNNIAQRVGQDQRGSGSENERTREQEDPREINTNINSNDLRRHSGRITSDDLRRLLGRMNRAEAANYFGVSVATFKRECRKHGIEKWPLKNGAERKKKRRKKDEWRLPDQHGGNNPSSTCRTMATNGLTEIQNVMVGQDLNEFFLTFVDGPTEEMPIDSGSLDDFRNWLSSLDAPPQGSDQPQIMSRLPENDQSTPQCGLPIVVSNEGVASNPDGGPVNPVERERTPEAHNDPIVPASGSHLVASTRSVNIADTTNQSFSQTDSDLARLAAEIEAVSESLKSQTGSPESSLPPSFLQYGEEVQAQVDLFFDLLKLPFEELVMNKSKELTDCMSILVQKRVFPLKEHIVLEIFFNNSSDTFSLFKYHNEEMRQKKELLNSFSSISTKVSNMQSEVLSVKSQLSALDQEENSLLLRLEQILAEKNALLQKKDGCSREFEKLKEEVKGVSAQTTAARADLLRNDIKRTEMIKRWENLLTFFANPTS